MATVRSENGKESFKSRKESAADWAEDAPKFRPDYLNGKAAQYLQRIRKKGHQNAPSSSPQMGKSNNHNKSPKISMNFEKKKKNPVKESI